MVKNFADTTASISSRGEIVTFTVQYAIIAILLCFSLVIAKQMGAMGAESVQKGLTKAGKKMQGYAGRISKRYAAPAAGAIVEGKGRVGKALQPLTKIPLVGRGLAGAAVMAESEIAKYEKKYSSYSDAGLKVLEQRRHLLNISQRKAIERIQKRRAQKKARQDILNDPNTPSIEKIRALVAEAEETVESAKKVTTEKKEPKKETKET